MARMQMGLLRTEAFSSAYIIENSSLFTDSLSYAVFSGDSLFGVGNKFVSGEDRTAQIVRMDAVSGKVLWIRSVSGLSGGFRATVVPFANGDIAVGILSGGNMEVLRIAPDASIVWQRILDPAHSVFANDNQWLAIDGNDDLYLILPGSSLQSVNFMKLLGATGLTSWNRNYTSTAVNFNTLSCAVTPAGKMIIGGVKGSNDHFLLFINTDGTIDQGLRVNDSGSDLNGTGKGARGIDVGLDGNIYVAWGWNAGVRLTKLNSSFVVQWTQQWAGVEFAFAATSTGVEDRIFILGAEDIGTDDRAWIGSVNSSGASFVQRLVLGTGSREIVNLIANITRSFLVIGGSESSVNAGVLDKFRPDFSNAVDGNGIDLVEGIPEAQTSPTVTLVDDTGSGAVAAVTNTAGSRTLTTETFTTTLLT